MSEHQTVDWSTVGEARKRSIDSRDEEENGALEVHQSESLPPRKRLRKDSSASEEHPDVVTAAADAVSEEGEVQDVGSELASPQAESDVVAVPVAEVETAAPAAETAPSKRSTWNHGVGGSLRTSFGKPLTSLSQTAQIPALPPRTNSPTSPTSPAKSSPLSPEPLVGADAEPAAEMDTGESSENAQRGSEAEASQASKAQEPLVFAGKKKILWQLPPLPEPDGGKGSKWQDKLTYEQWCEKFCAMNPTLSSKVSATVLVDAFRFYMSKTSFSKKQRKDATQAASTYAAEGRLKQLLLDVQRGPAPQKDAEGDENVKQEPSAREWASVLEDQYTNGEAPREEDETNGTAGSGPAPSQLSREEELSLLRAYFPGVSETTLFCVQCASRGHLAKDCPETACKFCSAQNHTSAQCRTRRRCTKCRQLGHDKGSCKEKLALAPGEVDECAICASTHHTETACSMVWRSYHFDAATARKVKDIPAYCYFCGSSAHFGRDCPSNEGVHVSGRVFSLDEDIWSNANRDLYVDKEAGAEAIAASAYASAPPEAEENGRPTIPGRSIVRQTHVYFSESSDEEEEGFIRRPVQRQQAAGSMRFSDIARSSRGGASQPPNGSRSGGNSRGQPQNNNGRNGRGGGQPPAGASLPPRPPQPSASQQGGPQRGGRNGGQPTRGGHQQQQPSQRNTRSNQQNQGRQNGGGQRGGGQRGGANLGRRGGRPRRGAP